MIFNLIATWVTASAWYAGLATAGRILVSVAFAAGSMAVSQAIAKQQLKKLQGQQSNNGTNNGTKLALSRSGVHPISFPLGVAATAGSLAYGNTWGAGNEYVTRVITLSDVPIASLRKIFINGVEYDYPSSAPSDEKGHYFSDDHTWVKFYDGTQISADAFLINSVSSGERTWDESHKLTGVAYAIVTTRFNKDAPKPMPDLLFEIEATVGSNPAAQIDEVLSGVRFSDALVYGLRNSAVKHPNWDPSGSMFSVEGLNTGGVVEVSTSIAQTINDILTSSGGRMADCGGFLRLLGPKPINPVTHFTDGDLLLDTDQSSRFTKTLSDRVDGVNSQYNDAAGGWQRTESPNVYKSGLSVDEINDRYVKTLNLSFTSSAEQVQKIQKWGLQESLRIRSHVVGLPLKFLGIEPLDYVTWTSERHGYSDKMFRVDAVTEDSAASVTISITEVDSDDYSWSGSDYVAPTYPTSSRFEPVSIPLNGFSVSSGVKNDALGVARTPFLLLNWTPNPTARAVQVTVREKSGGAVVHSQEHADPQSGAATIASGIQSGVQYQVRVRHVLQSTNGAWSNWLDVTAATVSVTADVLSAAIKSEIAAIETKADNALADADSATTTAQTAQISADNNAAAITEEAAARADADSAIATEISTVKSTVDELSSSVTEQSSAITDLKGNQAASYSLRAVAGDASAGLEIVAADSVNNPSATAILLNADNVIATNTLSADKLRIDGVTFDTAEDGSLIITDGSITSTEFIKVPEQIFDNHVGDASALFSWEQDVNVPHDGFVHVTFNLIVRNTEFSNNAPVNPLDSDCLRIATGVKQAPTPGGHVGFTYNEFFHTKGVGTLGTHIVQNGTQTISGNVNLRFYAQPGGYGGWSSQFKPAFDLKVTVMKTFK